MAGRLRQQLRARGSGIQRHLEKARNVIEEDVSSDSSVHELKRHLRDSLSLSIKLKDSFEIYKDKFEEICSIEENTDGTSFYELEIVVEETLADLRVREKLLNRDLEKNESVMNNSVTSEIEKVTNKFMERLESLSLEKGIDDERPPTAMRDITNISTPIPSRHVSSDLDPTVQPYVPPPSDQPRHRDRHSDSTQQLPADHNPQSDSVQRPYSPHDSVQRPYSAHHSDQNSHSQQRSNNSFSGNQSARSQINIDHSRLLTRVNIPKFRGEKKNYETFKAAFMSCVDSVDATPQYKLLKLRDCLEGEPLRVIESLGYSSEAYSMAKERLEIKYGGQRRQVMMRYDELERFKPVRDGNEKDLEQFTEFLDVMIVTMKDTGRTAELETDLFYTLLQKKLGRNLLAKYQQYISDSKSPPNIYTLRKFANDQCQYQIIANEMADGVTHVTKRAPHQNKTFVASHGASSSDRKYVCIYCKSDHGLWICPRFKRLSVADRWKFAKEQRLCYRCIGGKHRGDECSRTRECGKNGCKKNHHHLLHNDSERSENNDTRNRAATVQVQETVDNPSTAEHTATVTNNRSSVSLRTVSVIVSNGSKCMKVNALLDDGSTCSYINSDVANELNLNGTMETLNVNVLEGKQTTLQTSSVEFVIQSLDGKVARDMTAYTTNRCAGNLKVIEWSKKKGKYPHLQNINFPKYDSNKLHVDLLLGADQADLMCSMKEVIGNPGEPVARLTPLGWTCIGRSGDSGEYAHFAFFTQNSDDCVTKLVKKFWEVEDVLKSTEIVKPSDKQALECAENSIQYDGERYSIGVPWKKDMNITEIPKTYEMAKKRLENTQKKLNRTEGLIEAYSGVIQQYQEKGYIEKVTDQRTDVNRWYLPHFPVIKENRATTKIRIVFDAAAKCDGMSLNDYVNQGPKLLNDLFDVLLQFRKEPVAVVCDIKEMYYQIAMKEDDKPYHSFLWENDVYQFNRVVFGVNSSPFLAQYVAQQHAKLHQDEYPNAANAIQSSTYMDDTMTSVKDIETGKKLYTEMSELLQKAGMKAHKWASNESEVLSIIPEEEKVIKEFQKELNSDKESSVNTLGVLWLPKEDMFKVKTNKPEEVITKRSYLSSVAKLFDPLGLFSPFVVTARILLQEMWAKGYDWDEKIDSNLEQRALQWYSDLDNLDGIRVQRFLTTGESDKLELHTFCDASTEAYGACTYLRDIQSDGNAKCTLVASKVKVAPLQSLSIPRLELMAAVMGVQLAIKVGKALKIDISEFTLWSDSADVLYWIRGMSRQFKPFVAHRVGEIQSATEPNQWKHVPTKENPADFLSRGFTADQLKDSETWWHGPQFLSKPMSEWPETKMTGITDDSELRRKYRSDSENTMFSISCNDSIENYSNWTRMVRIFTWIKRFIDNCMNEEKRSGQLTCSEIAETETEIISNCQEEAFADEIKAIRNGKNVANNSPLKTLNPILDEDSVLRSQSRLEYASSIPWETKYPVILPKHDVTKLIIRKAHEEMHHAGTNQVLAHLSTRYWIISARDQIRKVEKECKQCARWSSVPRNQMMAPLPVLRTEKTMKAFTNSSIDYAGPFMTKQGRGKSRTKRYMCLFTCMETRAVHIEIAYSMSTDAFLNAFARFTARRGTPTIVYSDNGSNFVGAKGELSELQKLSNDAIEEQTAHRGIQWHFNPPAAPHFSGIHESMIKSAKRAVYAILNSADITDEELMTAFAGAEDLINSRPLTYQSANPKDIVPLTPNHFLFGQMGGKFAPEAIDTTEFNPRKRWRRVQELIRHVWQRWIRELLPTLGARKKWQSSTENYKVGDVVLVVSTDLPRGSWPLGRITQLHPGSDGKVRVVKVKVKDTVITRPIVKLCPLDCS